MSVGSSSICLCVALRQIIITIGFLIALMAVIGRHAPVDLGTFNPAGPAQCRRARYDQDICTP